MEVSVACVRVCVSLGVEAFLLKRSASIRRDVFESECFGCVESAATASVVVRTRVCTKAHGPYLCIHASLSVQDDMGHI